MDKRGAVVDHYPLGITVSVIIIRLYSIIFQKIIPYGIGDGRYLLGRISLTDDELMIIAFGSNIRITKIRPKSRIEA